MSPSSPARARGKQYFRTGLGGTSATPRFLMRHNWLFEREKIMDVLTQLSLVSYNTEQS